MGEIVNINDNTLTVYARKFKYNKQDKVIAIALSLNDLDNIANQLPAVKELNMDIKAIFEASYDVIYVSNGAGTTLSQFSLRKVIWCKTRRAYRKKCKRRRKTKYI